MTKEELIKKIEDKLSGSPSFKEEEWNRRWVWFANCVDPNHYSAFEEVFESFWRDMRYDGVSGLCHIFNGDTICFVTRSNYFVIIWLYKDTYSMRHLPIMEYRSCEFSKEDKTEYEVKFNFREISVYIHQADISIHEIITYLDNTSMKLRGEENFFARSDKGAEADYERLKEARKKK